MRGGRFVCADNELVSAAASVVARKWRREVIAGTEPIKGGARSVEGETAAAIDPYTSFSFSALATAPVRVFTSSF